MATMPSPLTGHRGGFEGHTQSLDISQTSVYHGLMMLTDYTVTLRFAFPAWDEVHGIPYTGIRATSKAEAVRLVRSRADRDGHLTGKGRYTLTAVPTEVTERIEALRTRATTTDTRTWDDVPGIPV